MLQGWKEVFVYSAMVVLFVALITGVGSRSQRARSVRADVKADDTPDYVKYWGLVHHLTIVTEQANDEAARGNRSELIDVFRREAELDVSQLQAVLNAARNCEIDVALVDQRARAIIDRARMEYPNGRNAAGQDLPPPPPELAALQEERNNRILLARDQIRQVLGEDEFQRFNAFVLRRFSPSLVAARSTTVGN